MMPYRFSLAKEFPPQPSVNLISTMPLFVTSWVCDHTHIAGAPPPVAEEEKNPTPSEDEGPKAFIAAFNRKPKRAVEDLLAQGFSREEIVKLLMEHEKVKKVALGDYLGEGYLTSYT